MKTVTCFWKSSVKINQLDIENKLNKIFTRGKKITGKSIKRIEVIFCNDSFICKFNEQYLKKGKPTDVLSFKEQDLMGNEIGQIVISLQIAKRQAKELKIKFEDEVKFLFCHGLLHIFGYHHYTKEEEEIMLELQNKIIGPYLDRVETPFK